MRKVSIIIPTKNEEECIFLLLTELKKYYLNIGEIIIVDAMSTDKTIQISKKFNCRIILQKKNQSGYGAAIIKGIKSSVCKYSLILDGDGSKNPLYINQLLKKINSKDLDFVFAERYGKNAGSFDDTIITYIGNRIFTYLGKFFFKLNINDILHTFFICKNSSFKKLRFEYLNFGFCAELPIKIHQYKLKYSSIPTIERRRFGGLVKVRSLIDGMVILRSMLFLFFASLGKKF